MTRFGQSPLDRCGVGTPWGCGGLITRDAHVLLNGRVPLVTLGGVMDDGTVLFHAGCWAKNSERIPTRSARVFTEGLLRELRNRI